MLPLMLLAAPPPPPAAACCRVLNGADLVNAATAVCVGQRDGRAYLLSAAHAVPPDQAQTFQFFAPDGGDTPARVLRGGDILQRWPDPDLVLLRVPVDGPPLPELPLVARDRRPRRLPAAATAVGCPRGVPPAARPEVILAKRLVRRDGGGLGLFWETEAAPVGGMSGGPLLDAGGAVVGICSAANPGTGRGYYTAAEEILAAVAGTEHRWLLEPPDRRAGR
jgi:S1-C subfamily serine protease